MTAPILANDNDQEQWHPIVGWGDLYLVSDHGRIRSLDRTVTYGDGISYVRTGRVLKQHVSSNGKGHLFVTLCRNGIATPRTVHLLVFAAFIGEITEGMEVDHRDRNKLNNLSTNLRLATKSQNAANVAPSIANISGVKGVAWDSSRNKYRARIKVNGKDITLGRFPTIAEATAVYNAAAQQYFGEFAVNLS